MPLRFLITTCLLIPLSAYAQTTLTGAVQFSTSSTGSFVNNAYWNTLGGDLSYDLWLALNPDGTSQVNGPSDDQATISIPLQAGNTYKYYTFGAGNSSTSFTGLNLFFDGNNSTPGISAFGPLNDTTFLPDDSSSTETLQITTVQGSGATFYSSGGVIVVLTGFNWNAPAAVPGNVCQPYAFAPGDTPVYFGSFSLRVFPAAVLSISDASGLPFTNVTLSGSGFASGEQVGIYGGSGSSLIGSASANSGGSFSTTITEPQHPYGTLSFFALGDTSGELGAAIISVTPGVSANPQSVEPGATTVAQGFGFGAGEVVSVYLDEPRQLLGTVTANKFGSFVSSSGLSVTIPTNAILGSNALIGIGATTGAVGIGKLTVD